jgi:hypothetical protein
VETGNPLKSFKRNTVYKGKTFPPTGASRLQFIKKKKCRISSIKTLEFDHMIESKPSSRRRNS